VLNGIALTNLVVPVFRFTLWANASQERVLARWRELGAMLLFSGVLTLPALLGVDAALIPLSAVSALGVVAILWMINSMLATIVLRRDSYATTWRQAWPTLLLGAAITAVELGVLIGVRVYVSLTWGLPF
jgi:hypothetical protein